MPRRSSSRSGGGGFGGFSRSSFGSRKAYSPPRSSRAAIPPSRLNSSATSSQKPSMFSGLGSTMAHGFAFGAGSGIAHSAVGGLMGNRGGNATEQNGSQEQPMAYGGSQVEQQQTINNPCMNETTSFLNCLKENSNNIEACQNMMAMLKSCEQKYSGSK